MIYAVQHDEKFYLPLMKDYKILKVGKLYEDDGRNNINELNPFINETTALYDLWENHDDEIIGLTHYRRIMFDKDIKALTFENAKKILKDKDMIVTVYQYYENSTIYDYFRYAISLTSPNALPVFDKYMGKLNEIDPKIIRYFKTKNKFIGRNMFVGKKEVVDKYCEWLFPIILPLVEEFVNNDLEQAYGQERLLGHFVERMFSYWLEEILGIDKLAMVYYLTFEE